MVLGHEIFAQVLVVRDFFEVKHRTWIVEGISSIFFFMAPLALSFIISFFLCRNFFSGGDSPPPPPALKIMVRR